MSDKHELPDEEYEEEREYSPDPCDCCLHWDCCEGCVEWIAAKGKENEAME